ncbi:hypothetical protein GA0116948_10517 [Chitinophaga costaii]|uniref:Uncharacterized protein n=1 Tax=Chitinophaga costaii TaxID=1335309 RepID=A0A1C4D1L0_9BACT|nr:hypothetical protein GA0116948_10517 [Chitinophaga costaii]
MHHNGEAVSFIYETASFFYLTPLPVPFLPKRLPLTILPVQDTFPVGKSDIVFLQIHQIKAVNLPPRNHHATCVKNCFS